MYAFTTRWPGASVDKETPIEPLCLIDSNILC
jgi:hypothetical protein